MKSNKNLWFFLVLLMASLCMACGNKSTQNSPESAAEVHGPGMEHTATYVCPMHCKGSGSDEAGTCPVCGMDYVLHSEHTSDGHNHQ